MTKTMPKGSGKDNLSQPRRTTEPHERQTSTDDILQDQAKILHSILNSIGEGVVVADETGKFLLFNPVAEKLTGIGATETSPDEWSKRYGIFKIDTTTPYPTEDLPLAKAIRGEETDEQEMFVRNAKQPEGVFLSVTGRPLKDEQGVVKGGVVVFRDITERKRAEQALKVSESRFRRLAESDIIGVIEANFRETEVSGQIVDANDAFLKMVGYSRKDLPIRWDGMTPAEWAQLDERAVRQLIETGVATPWEKEYFHKKGHRVPILLGVAMVEGTKNRCICFVLDITDRKRAERHLEQTAEELARSNAELEQFASVASHDLREPLRVVASYLQLLERRCTEKLDREANKLISRTVDSADRMQTLINDLLNYSRVTTRGQPFKATNCSEILRTVQHNLKMAIDESGAKITSDTLPKPKADQTQLVQLFQNLISNAIKFRGEGSPEIHVAAERQDRAWLFSVSDNGIGIKAEHADRIFAIFQRLHQHGEYPGTGIGLAVCKKIVERHGGEIWFESELGHGTTFFFTIPDAKNNRAK